MTVEVRKVEKDQEKKENGAEEQGLKKQKERESCSGWERGVLRVREPSFPPHLCLLPFLWISPPPNPCGDHMTGATYITAISKNTSAERFMRKRAGSNAPLRWCGRLKQGRLRALANYLALLANVQADDCEQTSVRSTVGKGCKCAPSACERVSSCGANQSYSSKGSQSCMQQNTLT